MTIIVLKVILIIDNSMGIKDLYKVIADHAPDQLVEFQLYELSGFRIAIDISVFLYKFIRTAGDVHWMNIFILFLCTLKKYHIKAVCIFDGPSPPIEKREEQLRRRTEVAKSVDRLKICKELKDELWENYVTSDKKLTDDLIERCRSVIHRSGVDFTDYNDTMSVYSAINNIIKKLNIQTLPITSSHSDLAKDIVRFFGFTCFQAEGEAEALCSYLAIHNYVDAVLTEDTDVLAYGTPLMLAFKDFKLTDQRVHAISLPHLLKALDLTQESFRDLCIMLSCDYNDRILGYPPFKKSKKPINIGMKHAFSMITEYKSIENMLDCIPDPSPLKYKRCRELFTPPDAIHLVKYMVPCDIPPDFKEIENLIIRNRLSISMEFIQEKWKPTPITYI